MNECNTSLFANPQYVGGQNVSAARCGAFLAAAYDALKAVDPTIFVWGLGLSPRGNPVPKDGSSPRATNPVDWLGSSARGTAQSGRTAPLMDGLDLHPVPDPAEPAVRDGLPGPDVVQRRRTCRASTRRSTTRSRAPRQPTVGPGPPAGQPERGGHPDDSRSRPSRARTPASRTARAWRRRAARPTRPRGTRSSSTSRSATRTSRRSTSSSSSTRPSLEGWQSGLFYPGYVPKLSAAAFTAELAKTAGRCPTGEAAYFAPSAAPAIKLAPEKKAVAKKAVCEEGGRQESAAKASKKATKKVVKKTQHRK